MTCLSKLERREPAFALLAVTWLPAARVGSDGSGTIARAPPPQFGAIPTMAAIRE